MDTSWSTRLPGSIFFFLVLLGAVRANLYAAHMPATVASHFGAHGRANGWQSQTGFFGLDVVVMVLAAVIAFGVPRVMMVVPPAAINLPNKAFWFGPQQRESTLAFFRAQFAWFGSALLAFLLVVNELVFRANLTSPRQLSNTAFAAALVLFLAFSGFWTIRMILHFSRKPTG
jgi:uncharacterized membrane protein